MKLAFVVSLVLAGAFVVVPARACAQAEPTECATTVRCTGAAAPLALPDANVQPSAAPVVVQPSCAAPPVAAPMVVPPMVVIAQPTLVAPAPSPQVVIVPQHDVLQVLADGTRLVLTPNGWWRERDIVRSRRPAWITGLVVLLSHWTFAIFADATDGRSYAPVVGPFLMAARDVSPSSAGGWVYLGLAQTAGAIAVIVGAATRSHRLERTQVTSGPAVWPLPNGLAGRF